MAREHQVTEYMLPDMDSTFKLFAAHLRTVTSEWSYPRHSHPLFEVNLLLAGSQEMIVGGKRYVQQPGDFLLLRPEEVHESRALGTEPMTYYCLHFNVDEPVLRELLCRGEEPLHAADGPLAGVIRPSLDKLIALTSDGAGAKLADKMRAMSAVFELFAGLSEGLAERETGAPGSRMNRIAAEIAAGLERSVEEPEAWTAAAGGNAGSSSGIGSGSGSGSGGGSVSVSVSGSGFDGGSKSGGGSGAGLGAVGDRNGGALDEDRSRETVAAVTAGLGYSASSCNRIFRSVYGMSPRQYLSALKLKKAKLLLMEPELSVEAVSMRLGYKDIAHFSRQFKRWTGESPGKFRARFHI
nr:AraC family transcriptional regulator [Paenibacillus rubinfantis]